MPDRSIPFYNLILRCDDWQEGALSPPEGFFLRGFQPGDEAVWAALEHEIGDFPSREEARDYFTRTYAPHSRELARRCWFALDSRGRAVGTCTAWRDPGKDGKSVASLHWLAVSPEVQGRGLGRVLCRAALSVFREAGEFPVYLHTQPWSWKALFLYVQEGFRLQRADTFGGYENQYAQGMAVLSEILPQERWRELVRCSQS